MTSMPTDLKKPVHEAGQNATQPRRPQRNPRRRRPLRGMISHYLDRMLSSRQLFNVGLALLLLVGFIHISLVNDVLGTKEKPTYSYTSERKDFINTEITGLDARPVTLTSFYRDPSGSGSVASSAPANPEQVVSEKLLASTWATGDLRTIRLLPVQDDAANATQAEDVTLASDTSAPEQDDKASAIYVVNEGGSLWRAAKRFIDDEVLLDRLIDNLEQSGMNVRNVSAGAAFIVNDLGNDGMLVTLDNNGAKYETLIVGSGVETSVQLLN